MLSVIRKLDGGMVVSPAVVFSRLTAKARLRHLQLLLNVAELGNLQRAASAVGMSQPAATHALGELEALIGAPLFERHSRGMRATATGQAILPPLRAALRAMQECAEAVTGAQMGTRGTLRVGSINAGISGLMRKVLPPLSAQHPQLAFEVRLIEADEMLNAWARTGLDVLLCREPAECPDGTRFVPLLSDRYCVVGRPGHRLAGRAGIELGELNACTWLMQPPRSIASRDFYQLWEGCAANPPLRWVNSRSLFMMLAMHQQQELLSFIPYNSVSQLLDDGLLVEIDCRLGGELMPVGAMFRSEEARGNEGLATFLDALAGAGDLSARGTWR